MNAEKLRARRRGGFLLEATAPGATSGAAVRAVAAGLPRALDGRHLRVAIGLRLCDAACGDHLQAEMRRSVPGNAIELVATLDPVAALRAGAVDLAAVDLRVEPRVSETLPLDLDLVGVLRRRPAGHGVITARPDQPLRELPLGAAVGATSARCAAQLSAWRRDLRVDLAVGGASGWRQLLDEGALQALVLDYDQCPQGLRRWVAPHPSPRASRAQGDPVLVPAPGAGAVGVIARVTPEAEPFVRLAAALTDVRARAEHAAEQACLIGLAHAVVAVDAVAVHAHARAGTVTLSAIRIEERCVARVSDVSGPVASARELGLRTAAELVDCVLPPPEGVVMPLTRRTIAVGGRPDRC